MDSKKLEEKKLEEIARGIVNSVAAKKEERERVVDTINLCLAGGVRSAIAIEAIARKIAAAR